MAKISIIVPVYNVEKYIDQCIKSILAQSFSDFELILVNDGSKDNCANICDEYAKKDKRIKVIHKKNGGLSSARNAGLDASKGDYIGFIDSDDYIDENMYKYLYDKIVSDNYDMAICSFSLVNQEGNKIKEDNTDNPIKDEILNQLDLFKKIYEKNGYYYITVVNKLYKKELFNNLKFENGKIHEDEFIFHKIVNKCKNIITIKDRLYYYRQNLMGITKSEFKTNRIDAIEAFIERAYFADENNLDQFSVQTKRTSVYLYLKISKEIDPRDKIAITNLKKYKKTILEFVLTPNVYGKKDKLINYIKIMNVKPEGTYLSNKKPE